jgi:glutathione S-transferase
MKLIGQFDSPFARRVGIALRNYNIEFEHLPYSVFRDAERIMPFNPLRRVPTLILDDGTVLTETFVCLEILDERFADEHGLADERLLLPRSGPQRLEGLRLCALAAGTADKAVSLAYEREVRESISPRWAERCTKQIRDTLERLETEWSRRKTAFLLGERLSHADIAVTCAFTFIADAHPTFFEENEIPTIRALAARCESRPEFASVFQAFDIPSG